MKKIAKAIWAFLTECGAARFKSYQRNPSGYWY